MAGRLADLGYVGEGFEEEIYEREQLSSTAFQDFAIPHAMKMHADKTGISVLISDTPVEWDSRQVHIVMMLCFNREERFIFNEVFEPLTLVLGSRENIRKLAAVGDYREFIELLTALL